MRFYPSVRDHTLGCLEGKGNGMGEAADRVGRGGTPPPPGTGLGPQIQSLKTLGCLQTKHTHITASLKPLGSWARFAFRKFLLRTALGSRQGRGRSDLGQIWSLKVRTQAKAMGRRSRELESRDLNQQGKQMNVSRVHFKR